MRNIALIILLVMGTGAAGQSYRERIYDAYLEGRMDRWKTVMDEMERRLERSNDLSLMYELTEAQYGLPKGQ